MIDWSGFKYGKGVPRVVARIDKKRALEAQERSCRAAVKARDHGKCQVCGKPSKHVHHLTLRSQGGRWTSANTIALCTRCHQWVHGALITLAGNPDLGPVSVTQTALGVAAGIRVPQRTKV